MTTKTIIALQHVSKSITANKEINHGWLKRVFNTKKNIFSLNDVSLTIEKNLSVGLCGPNGAGKTTLLKLISGMLKPDSGEVTINGNVAPLFDFESGINPKLTGLDIIYSYTNLFNKIPHAEIYNLNQKIIEFSGLSTLLNVPTKQYTLGMKARLSLAIGLFYKSDILLIDGALSAVDAGFYQMCLRKLKEVRGRRTIIFTFHNLGLMQQLCDKSYFMNGGTLRNEKEDLTIWLIKNKPLGDKFVVHAHSGSMYPCIKINDKLTIRRESFELTKPGDVAVFCFKNIPALVTHRIIMCSTLGGKKVCITKGDSSTAYDPWELTDDQYVGKIIKINNRTI